MIGAALTGFVGRALQPALVAGLAGCLAVIGWQAWRLHTLRTEHAEASAEWSRLSAAAARAAQIKSTELQAAVDAARGALHEQTRTNAELRRQLEEAAGRIARLHADARGLRSELAAARAARGADDSLAACRAWAGALEEVLADGAGIVAAGSRVVGELAAVAGSCAADHDDRAAEVEALLAAWPKP